MSTNVLEMTIQDWSDVKGNPRQRNTEDRAEWAKRHHLAQYEKPHKWVMAAVMGGNLLCKIDGHTRDILWMDGSLGSPPDGKVSVILIDVDSIQEAKDLYDMLDSKRAVKTPNDIIFGACRENGFRLTSPLLKSCRFSNQLRLADAGKFGGRDVYELVKSWKPYLKALDALGLPSKYTILIAIMLIAVKRDGANVAGPFFVGLSKDLGQKESGGKMDGIEALSRHIDLRRAEGKTAGYENLSDILIRGWNCYVDWLDGKKMRGVRAKDQITDVIAKLNAPKKGRKVMV